MLDIYECDRMLYPREEEPVDTGMKCPHCGEPIFCGEDVAYVEIGETHSFYHNDCLTEDLRDFVEIMKGRIHVFQFYWEDFV